MTGASAKKVREVRTLLGFIHTGSKMSCKKVCKLDFVVRMMMVVAIFAITAIAYFLRDKGFLVGAMCNDDVMVEVDGVREDAVLFVSFGCSG